MRRAKRKRAEREARGGGRDNDIEPRAIVGVDRGGGVVSGVGEVDAVLRQPRPGGETRLHRAEQIDDSCPLFNRHFPDRGCIVGERGVAGGGRGGGERWGGLEGGRGDEYEPRRDRLGAGLLRRPAKIAAEAAELLPERREAGGA